jgi:hypothetical protein
MGRPRGWNAEGVTYGVLFALLPLVAMFFTYRPDLAARISPSYTPEVAGDLVTLALKVCVPFALFLFFLARPRRRTIDWASGRAQAGLRSAPLEAITGVELRSGSYEKGGNLKGKRWYHRIVLQLDPERAGRADLRLIHVEADTPYDDRWALVTALAAALRVPAQR